MAGFVEVGRALALLRKGRGIDQTEMASRLKLARNTSVSAIETGNPTASTIARFLSALDCDHHDLADAIDRITALDTGYEVRGMPEAPRFDEIAERAADVFRELATALDRRSPHDRRR